MTTRRTSASDAGFTLIEMMVAVVVLALVALSIGGALIFGIKATLDNHTHLDQSLSEMSITRFLSGDIYAAEGPVVVNSSSDAICGGVANPGLKFKSRSLASVAAPDTTVVWALTGTNLVRRTCNSAGTQTDSFVVASAVKSFTPATCAAPCTATTISVTFSAAGNGSAPAQTWTLTMARRGVTS